MTEATCIKYETEYNVIVKNKPMQLYIILSVFSKCWPGDDPVDSKHGAAKFTRNRAVLTAVYLLTK
jgi:hypothetical protein